MPTTEVKKVKHVVAYSGGLGSFAVADWAVQKFGPENVVCVFQDTKTEDPDLYRFLDDTEKFLRCEQVRMADGRNIWEVFMDVRHQGNTLVDPCSRILKREQFKKYIDQYTPEEIIIYYGIGADEKHRHPRLVERWKPYKVESPLIELGTTKEQILARLDEIKIDPPIMYEQGFPHNNCGGFCIKTGQRSMKILLEQKPETYKWHEEQQEKLFAVIGPHGTIRKTTDGELKYLSMKQFREMVQDGEKPQMFEDGACDCFA